MDQLRNGRSVEMNRAYDYLNFAFGFHNCLPWMPVYATFKLTSFGIAQGAVFSEETEMTRIRASLTRKDRQP